MIVMSTPSDDEKEQINQLAHAMFNLLRVVAEPRIALNVTGICASQIVATAYEVADAEGVAEEFIASFKKNMAIFQAQEATQN